MPSRSCGLATLGLLGLAAGLTLRTGGSVVIALVSILALLLAALAAQARGRICEWALADALFSDRAGHPYRLSIMTRSTRHIICATEIQTGQALWFTAKGAVSRAFTLSDEPSDLSLARAVQASACLPIAFPPRRLRAQPTRLLEANWPRTGRLPTRAVVVDGGVRDNLGVDVFLAWGEEVPAGEIENVGDLIVVSGSATRVKRSRLGRDIPLLGEIFSLRKLSNLPYSTREANTRRALEWRFRAAPDLEPQGWPRLRGTLVHIEESPAELADEIQLWLRDWEWQSTPPGERSHLDHPYGRKRQVEFLFGLDPPPARWVTNFLSRSEQYDASGRAEAVLEVLARADPDTANVVTTWRRTGRTQRRHAHDPEPCATRGRSPADRARLRPGNGSAAHPAGIPARRPATASLLPASGRVGSRTRRGVTWPRAYAYGADSLTWPGSRLRVSGPIVLPLTFRNVQEILSSKCEQISRTCALDFEIR